MVFKLPTKIKSDNKGYKTFVRLSYQSRNLESSELILDFSKTGWFEANLCAVLGAILSNVSEKRNKIKFVSLKPSIKDILTKNHFLSFFGGATIPDKYKTTIKFSIFDVAEGRKFQEYLDKELLSQRDLPKMSKLLRNKINKSILEIFSNAHIHGNCKYIFSSGQYYPRKRRLDFTVVDLGRSIHINVNTYLHNVNPFLHKELNGSDAIRWAIQEGNTTKTGDIPGGLGLSLLEIF